MQELRDHVTVVLVVVVWYMQEFRAVPALRETLATRAAQATLDRSARWEVAAPLDHPGPAGSLDNAARRATRARPATRVGRAARARAVRRDHPASRASRATEATVATRARVETLDRRARLDSRESTDLLDLSDHPDSTDLPGRQVRYHHQFISKFHYTDPTGPGSPTKSAHVVGYELNSTTRTRPDPHGPNGVLSQKSPCGSVRVRSGPCQVRVVEFSSSPTMCADFVRVGSGPCRVRVGSV